MTPYELGSLLKKMDELKDASIIAMGGSLPTGVPPETYRRTILMFKSKGVSTLLDADGDALRTGIEGGPDYIKPNLHELSQLVGRELSGIDDITEAAEWVRSKGVGTVLVSMGADGVILLVGENKRYRAVPPKIEAVNTVGVGDSSVAGFVYGLATGLDLEGSSRFATAAGTATALKPGTSCGNKEDIMAMLPQIVMKDLSRSEEA